MAAVTEKCEVCGRNVGTAADYIAVSYRDVCWARTKSYESLADCRRIGYGRLAAAVPELANRLRDAHERHILTCPTCNGIVDELRALVPNQEPPHA